MIARNLFHGVSASLLPLTLPVHLRTYMRANAFTEISRAKTSLLPLMDDLRSQTLALRELLHEIQMN